MTSKKVAHAKGAVIPRTSDRTREFLKDWERHERAGQSDMARLKIVMMLLISNEGPLPPELKDHELKGDWKSHRDCHIHGDFLLIYKLEGQGNNERVIFTRVGTHSDLFG